MGPRIAVLLLLGVICLGFAAADIPVDCCLKANNKRVPIQIIESYFIQDAGNGCEIGATVFITKAGRKLCSSHHSKEGWVRTVIKILKGKKRSQ